MGKIVTDTETIIIEAKDVKEYSPSVPKPTAATAEAFYQVMLSDSLNSMHPDDHRKVIDECQEVLDYFRWANDRARRHQKIRDDAWEEYHDELYERGTMPNRVQ